MKRIFADYAYGEGPRRGCWWDETCDAVERPALTGARQADVAVIGAGFTGMSAAYHLARAGFSTVVLDTHFPGWGASGRNGGFCCLGGGLLEDAAFDARFGRAARLGFRATEKAAVDLVSDLIERFGLDVGRHSAGETELAHRPKDMVALRKKAEAVECNYGVVPELIEQEDLARHGLVGPFHGALTIPIGFGLNPRRFLDGVASAAEMAGAEICHNSPVLARRLSNGQHQLETPLGVVSAPHVIIATNGYSSEDLPSWLGGRYMPGQSNVLVTRPLTDHEIAAQGWSSDQMCYDTRHLLHYFRLMPDHRFLFGMRGGLMTGAAAERRSCGRLMRDFERLFPAWAQVEVTHMWSGMVCLTRKGLPYVGSPVPGSGLWLSLGYHGNGVAMATLAGRYLADLIEGRTADPRPAAMGEPLARFPFGRARRIVMPTAYAGLMLADLG
ncbi:oxidoreductase [Roseobacter cerasinus]|uniref:Oxidoreductase n=1 Tax=Roseobacter cerasinus TaxID=2602289 RepID=A0A640VMS0_9RHOB|nr:FAD-binding oxidoreductase [Roseobacter cerasinus]GFE49543.1 oxidoreductase [Roseobacter cerasinus]